jgi:hypothetical protein
LGQEQLALRLIKNLESAMIEPQWTPLFNTIYRVPPDQQTLVPKPADTDLNLFEEEMHIRLPTEFRSFIKLFGPGGFLCEDQQQVAILVPGCVGNSAFDMTRFNRTFKKSLRDSPVQQAFYKDPQQIERLVFFSQTPENDFFAWDPDNITDSKTFEMPVHQLLRLGEAATVVASTFQAFVEICCLYNLVSLSTSGRGHQGSNPAGCSYMPAQLTPQGKKALAKEQPGSTFKSKKRSTAKNRPKK